jgi:hypothetical protein
VDDEHQGLSSGCGDSFGAPQGPSTCPGQRFMHRCAGGESGCMKKNIFIDYFISKNIYKIF